MEDIERQIERWRRGLPASLAGCADVIDELEGHLRDELARLVAGGVPADEAWAKAVERLGTPDALAAEFAKVPPARWLPGTVVPAIVLVAGLGIGGPIASRVWGREAGPLLAIHVLTVAWGYLAALAAGGSPSGWWSRGLTAGTAAGAWRRSAGRPAVSPGRACR